MQKFECFKKNTTFAAVFKSNGHFGNVDYKYIS